MKSVLRWFSLILVLTSTIVLSAATGFAAEPAAAVTAVKAGKLLDPETGAVTPNVVILVEAGKIKAVGSSVAIPAGATVIDLSGETVLPGLFDAHTHLCFTIGRLRGKGFSDMLASLLNDAVTTTSAKRALQGAANAREMLEAGFTTVRDVGNAGLYADTALRQAIEEGLVPGPTVINAGRIIAPYGGQFPGVLNPERKDLGTVEYLYADTHDEIVKAVRENILYGAKVIKIVVDDQPYAYNVDDIRLVVSEAARAGLKVAAHCFTPEGAHAAVEAGVASVEHGQFMKDEDLVLMKKKGITLVGTDFSELAMSPLNITDVPLHQASVERLRRAVKIGVTMAFGSDTFAPVPGETRGTVALSYLDSFKEAGVPPKTVLQMFTVNGARLLGVEKERGFVKEGFAADLVAVKGNPLDDPSVLKHVVFVMKDGRIVRSK